MNWTLDPYDFPELVAETVDGFRRYRTPEGNKYPSVTTILSAGPSPHLDAWRDRIGHEEARKRTTQAANRGSQVHAIYEDYVLGRFDPSKYNPIQLELFNKTKRWLDNGMTKVHNIEFCLWSDRLKTAGRCDSLCEWDGVTSILDYKTTRYYKKEEWIEKYFLQESLYAMMVYERIGLKVPQIVTFMVAEEEDDPQIFVKRTEDYIKPAIGKIREYYAAVS